MMQYIIDAIRIIRLNLGLSQRDVSRFISPETDTNILGKIESPFKNASYTDQNLNLIAHGFSKRTQELLRETSKNSGEFDIKSEYTVFDFYPKKPLGDSLQLKRRIEIPLNLGPSGILNAILETKDFLDSPRSIREITDYCNSFNDSKWKSTNFTSTLEYAVRKGKLKKTELSDGGVRYQKA